MQEVFKDESGMGDALCEQLADAIGRDRYDLWLSHDVELRSCIDTPSGTRRVEFYFATGFLCDHARQTLGKELSLAVKQIFGDEASLAFCVAETTVSSSNSSSSKKSPTASPKEPVSLTRLSTPRAAAPAPEIDRTARGFDSLVVGKSNELAVRAAERLAAGKHVGGPLVLCGPAGCGKTHLLAAIRQSFRQRFHRARILSITSEQFVGHYVAAYRGGGLPSFRQKYRGANLLLLDDLHFMAKKRATLEELHHTIDRITTAGGQVVIASCGEPAQIEHLSEELLSRLRAGLQCEMASADFATRLEMARRRCDDADLPIEENALRLLAAGVSSGARELLGAIERLRARHELLGEAITPQLIDQTIGRINQQTIRPVAIDEIQKVVCDYFGVEGKALRSASRTKSVTQPRMLAMWLARKYTQSGWREIGDAFGGRSHSTVISAHRRIEEQMASESTIDRGREACRLEEAIVQIETALRTA